MATLYCIDDRHGTPCPQPCGPCQDECESTPVDEAAAREEFPGWDPTVHARLVVSTTATDREKYMATFSVASNGTIHAEPCAHANRVKMINGGWPTIARAREVAREDFENPGAVRVAPCARKAAANQ